MKKQLSFYQDIGYNKKEGWGDLVAADLKFENISFIPSSKEHSLNENQTKSKDFKV